MGGYLSGNGIQRTTDGGTSWSAYNTGLGNTDIKALVTMPGAILAGTDDGAYLLPLATLGVTGLAPTSGVETGGTTVTITGSGFTGTNGVTFGGTAATSYTVDSDTQITAVAPAHAIGTVDVVVTTVAGSSPTGTSSEFTYTAVPVELQTFTVE